MSVSASQKLKNCPYADFRWFKQRKKKSKNAREEVEENITQCYIDTPLGLIFQMRIMTNNEFRLKKSQLISSNCDFFNLGLKSVFMKDWVFGFVLCCVVDVWFARKRISDWLTNFHRANHTSVCATSEGCAWHSVERPLAANSLWNLRRPWTEKLTSWWSCVM